VNLMDEYTPNDHNMALRFNEHEYQHHVAEESQVHLRRRKKIRDEIDIKLFLLHDEQKNNKLNDAQLAIKCGRIVKTRLFKK
ncbi:unnamed protein product, partial [Didymodactylos carnosus]